MFLNTREAFPTTVRQAVHDFTQPLQALRMMLGLPGVVVDDARKLPQKVEDALEELDMQMNQLHTLARVLDGAGLPPAELKPFAQTLEMAVHLAPSLWQSNDTSRKGELHVYGRDCPMCLPTGNAAWIVNVLLDQAWRTRPKSRIIVGSRSYGKWVIVADDGDGMSEGAARDLEATLNDVHVGARQVALTSGLLLARLMVAGWGGSWRVISKPGKGSVFAFSVPQDCDC